MKYIQQFDVWWREICLKGDPLHRRNLTSDAFDAGYEAGRRDALLIIAEDIKQGCYSNLARDAK